MTKMEYDPRTNIGPRTDTVSPLSPFGLELLKRLGKTPYPYAKCRGSAHKGMIRALYRRGYVDADTHAQTYNITDRGRNYLYVADLNGNIPGLSNDLDRMAAEERKEKMSGLRRWQDEQKATLAELFGDKSK